MQWYPHYTGDYKRSTDHLSMLEHGAYRLLLDHYYDRDGDVLADPDRLFRICKALEPQEQEAVRFVIEEFFDVDGDTLAHARADEEIQKRADRSELAAKKAKKRWRNQKKKGGESIPEQMPQQMPQQNHGQCGGNAGDDAHDMLSTSTSTSTSTSIGTGTPKDSITPAKADVVEWWNALASGVGIKTIRTMTSERWRKFKLRHAEGMWDALGEIREAIEVSEFARTGNWFGFDWLVQNQTNWLKLVEGRYADRDESKGGSKNDDGFVSIFK